MTSRPAHVRLAILVDEEDERLCGDCPRKSDHGDCYLSGRAYTLLSEADGYEGGTRVHKGWWRSADCLSATSAQALDDAIVKAAEELRAEDFKVEDDFAGKYDVLVGVVDAKRAALSKGKTNDG